MRDSKSRLLQVLRGSHELIKHFRADSFSAGKRAIWLTESSSISSTTSTVAGPSHFPGWRGRRRHVRYTGLTGRASHVVSWNRRDDCTRRNKEFVSKAFRRGTSVQTGCKAVISTPKGMIVSNDVEEQKQNAREKITSKNPQRFVRAKLSRCALSFKLLYSYPVAIYIYWRREDWILHSDWFRVWCPGSYKYCVDVLLSNAPNISMTNIPLRYMFYRSELLNQRCMKYNSNWSSKIG